MSKRKPKKPQGGDLALKAEAVPEAELVAATEVLPVTQAREVVITQPGAIEVQQEFTQEQLAEVIAVRERRRSENTRIAYEKQWRYFEAWCKKHGRRPMPADAETIAFWLTDLAKNKRAPSTIDQAVSAVIVKHHQSGYIMDRKASGLSDQIDAVKKEARRLRPDGIRKVSALRINDLAAILAIAETDRRRGNQTLIDLRDSAILALGFAAALRRSEIVGLDYGARGSEDALGALLKRSDGLDVVLHTSKASQDAEVTVPLPLRDAPVVHEAMSKWLKASGIRKGEPLFQSIRKSADTPSGKRLSAKAVAVIIKERVERRLRSKLIAEGLDPDEAEIEALEIADGFSGHSMRRGCLTELATTGLPTHSIQLHSRHKTADMVAEYVDEATQRSHSVLGKLDWGAF